MTLFPETVEIRSLREGREAMKPQTVIGGILLIIGFLMFQTGISIALEQIPYTLDFLKRFTEILQLNLKTPTVILLFEYVGGTIAIIGFLICVSGLTSKEPVPLPSTSLEKGGGLLEEGLLGGSLFTSEPTLKCKYCGAEIDQGAVFCQKCHRALI